MSKILIVAIALALTASAADAGYKHKRYRTHHWVAQHAVPGDPYAAFYNHGPKPPWGAPQQCFTDEGYGRYWPCGAGPNGR